MPKHTAAVICEYNPFHRGHEYQIRAVNDEFGGSLCVMSGCFVQRGDMAVADKYSRAEAAVRCGASLVCENLFPSACVSARDFAANGVYTAHMLGADVLCFGIEDEFALIRETSEAMLRDDFAEKVKRALHDGAQSYPKAVSAVLAEYFGSGAAEALSKPNNILANEYLIVMKKYGMTPYPITRSKNFRSAAEIRAMSEAERESELPKPSAEALRNAARTDELASGALITALVQSELCRHKIKALPPRYGVDTGLLSLMAKHISDAKSLNELADACCNAAYTRSRVRRAAIAVAFGITPAAVKALPKNTLLLACDDVGRRMLSQNNVKLGVITKPADGAGRAYAAGVKAETIASKAYSKAYNPLRMRAYIQNNR